MSNFHAAEKLPTELESNAAILRDAPRALANLRHLIPDASVRADVIEALGLGGAA